MEEEDGFAFLEEEFGPSSMLNLDNVLAVFSLYIPQMRKKEINKGEEEGGKGKKWRTLSRYHWKKELRWYLRHPNHQNHQNPFLFFALEAFYWRMQEVSWCREKKPSSLLLAW